jgi:hypothetical protein
MSKPQLSFRVPRRLRDDIEAIQEEHGIEDRSEAARRVLRRGLNTYDGTASPGEELAKQATTVAGVGAVVAAIGAVMGQPWAGTYVLPMLTATFLFALLWASVRTLAGGDLV